MSKSTHRSQASPASASGLGRTAILFFRFAVLLPFLPGVLANCFIDDNGFERCNDGLSNAARIGIGIAGSVILIAIISIVIRRRRLQQYYLSYLPPQGAPPQPPPPQPQAYYANYAAYSGAPRYEQPDLEPQVVGVYSMYTVHASVKTEGSAAAPSAHGSPGPRYPPNVYSGGGSPDKV